MRLILALLLLLFVVGVLADPLPSDRKMDWDQTGVAFTGTIPYRTNIWKTYTTNDSASTINFDLNHSLGNSNVVVYFGPGDYYFNANLDIGPSTDWGGSGITIRGAGPGVTRFHWLTNTTFLEAPLEFRSLGRPNSPVSDTNQIVNWLTGYAKGSTNLTFDRTPTYPGFSQYDLKPGHLIILDQLQDLNGVGFNAEGWDGVSTNGGFEYPGVEYFRGGNVSFGQTVAGPNARIQLQISEVQSISGTNVVIWPPIQMTNWNSSFTPQAYWFGHASMEYVGVENLTIDCKYYDSPGVVSTYVNTGTTYTNYLPHFYGVFFQSVKFCWVTNVEFLSPKSGSISTVFVLGGQFDQTLDHEQRVVPGGGAPGNYGIDLKYESFSRVQNNIFDGITSPVLPDNAANFTVYSYNYATNCIFVSDGNNWMSHMIQSHGAGAHGNLFEGNEGSGINLDFIHGESGANCVIHRNRWLGQHEGNVNKISDTFAAFIMGTNRNVSMIGNVLGTAGYHTHYQYVVTDAFFSDFAKSIYRVGHYGNNAGQNEGDGATLTTLIRTMNYDTVTSTNGGVVIDQSLNTNLVNSYYLAGQPGWWTNTNYTAPSFPPIGPDLSPNYSKIPARLLYESGMFGSGGGGGGGGTTGGGGTSGGGTSGLKVKPQRGRRR